jgi:hypothetical protein
MKSYMRAFFSEAHCGPASEKEVDDFVWLTICAFLQMYCQ